MGRPRHGDYWDQVTKENGSLKCKRCGHKFKGGASRIKAHVEGIKGQGISICSFNPVDGVHNTIASSSADPQQVPEVANSREAFEGGNEIIEANTGGSIAHQNIADSVEVHGGGHGSFDAMYESLFEGGSMAHQNNTEPSNLLEANIGDHEMNNATSSGFMTNQYNTSFQANIGDHEMNNTTISGLMANQYNTRFQGGSMAHQNNTGPTNLLEANIGDHELNNAIINGLIANQYDTGFQAEGDDEMMDDMSPQNTNESTDVSEGSESLIDAVMEREWEWKHTFHSIHSDIRHFKQLFRELVWEEDDIKEQLKGLENRGQKHKRKVDHWLDRVQDLKRKASNMRYTVNRLGRFQVRSTVELTEEIRKHKKQKPLVLSNEIVGKNFEKNVKKMWKLLKDDKVFIIGIHGMGGVGKTCLVTFMENEIKRKRTFNHVFVVTVSHYFSISKLQYEIAEQIGAELNGNDEWKKAQSLSLALEAKGKSVLILDDVWKYIDLQKVGIPLKVNGIKVIVASRLEHVCLRMNCSPKSIVNMLPLSHFEGRELFLLKLGDHGTPAILPSEIANVANYCYCLPLGINVMARTMRGYLNDVSRWRHALKKLEKMEMGEEMEEEVLKVLKLSYDNLMEKNLKECFLHCALFLNTHYAYLFSYKSNLIMKLVDNGLINGTRTLQEIFDEGCFILGELKCHSLLVSDGDIRINGLVRNMVRLVIKKDHRYMVEFNKELTEMPDLQEWTNDLEVVYLVNMKIKEIHAGTAPNCPRLRTLILSRNLIKGIPECFFTHMNALAVLDLSDNYDLTRLPDSLCELRSLISLVLRGCCNLEYLPPLGELKALSRLDISNTEINQVLGLEELINLKWLDMSWIPCNLITGSMLSGLTNLQYLDLRCSFNIEVTEKDLEKMSKLECFAGMFKECHNYNNYVKNIQHKGFGPKTYHLHSGTEPIEFFEEFGISPDKKEDQIVSFGDCEEPTTHFLPRDLARLYIYDNDHWKCLCSSLLCNGDSTVQCIEISRCSELESLFCSLDYCCTFCNYLKELQVCHLEFLASLTAICKEYEGNGISPSLPSTSVFSRLTNLHITECNKIEKLFTEGLFRHLQNLEQLIVKSCGSLKEIFAERNSGGDCGDDEIKLPKLTNLTLRNLPKLKVVSKSTIVFGSVPEIDIKDCPKLKKFPIITTEAANSDLSDSDTD